MILVYTGNGKGKTTACAGQALRALGQGMTVSFCQFMKRDVQAGEQVMLGRLLGEDFCACGAGFFRDPAQRQAHRDAALAALAWAGGRLASGRDMLVLDEALYALDATLILRDELAALLDQAQAGGTIVVLSGRGLPDWLLGRADLVTEMREIKHPLAEGRPARRGIEF